MNSAFVIYSQDVRTGKIELYAVTSTEQLAQEKLKELKEDLECKELTKEEWDNIIDLLKQTARNKGWDIAKDQYVSVIYNYITSKYPIYILNKAQRAYQENKYIQYYINEIDYYES